MTIPSPPPAGASSCGEPMSIHVALRHVTHYRYDRLVNLSPHVVRLRPAPHCRTPILSYSLNIEPAGHFINWQQDPFSNYLARLVFRKNRRIQDHRRSGGRDVGVQPFDFFWSPAPSSFRLPTRPSLATSCNPIWPRAELTPALKAFIDGLDLTPVGTVNFWWRSTRKIHHAIRYLIRLEPGVKPGRNPHLASGSCRDSGWLLAQGAAPPGPGHPLCVRLSDPAQARRQIAGRPQRRRSRLHRPARPVRGSTCPAPAGLAWDPTSGLF